MSFSANREIADSEADEDEFLSETNEDPEVDFHSQDTVLLSGGVPLFLTPRTRYPLHTVGFNVNGRLPIETSRYKDIVAMDDEAEPTQPATQPYFDGRRAGLNSISINDEADVICILQPANPLAYDVIKTVAELTPQHILQNDDLGGNTQNDLEHEHSSSDNKEIALRISSKVQDICMGFVFGRDPAKCDIMLELPTDKMRVSNMHFRIFVNEGGIIMLEDTSTNGTIVDGKVLRFKDPTTPGRQMHMLQKGSTIQIILGLPGFAVKFNVTTPNRDRAMHTYHTRLAEYLSLIKEANRKHELRAFPGSSKHATPALPFLAHDLGDFNAVHSATPSVATPVQLSAATLLTAGSTPYNCGSKWNGGEIYNVIEKIGKGAFADVYKFATKREGKLYAVKELSKRNFFKDGVLDHKVTNELKIMKCLNHPHIVKYVDQHETPQYIFIVMEFVGHGDMLRYMNDRDEQINELQCQSTARQLSHALKYLHNCGITHRDVKPDNVLIESLDPFYVKLSDFGLSKMLDSDETFLRTFCGTLLYCAPEVYPEFDNYRQGLQPRKRQRHGEPPPKTSPYSSAVDIWSFAAVMFHLLCKEPPFKGSSENRGAGMLRNIMEKGLNVAPLRHSGVSRAGISLLEQMLSVNPVMRPTAAQCLRHPWIRDVPDVTLLAMDDDLPPEGLVGIREEEEAELDASQLSLYDANAGRIGSVSGSEADISDVDEIGDHRQNRLSVEAFRYPSLPLTEQINTMHGTQGPPNRLFGEIGSSDLRSSGVLSHGARVALQIMPRRNRGVEGNFDEAEPTEIGSNLMDQDNLQYPTPFVAPHPHHPLGTAPSLLGTEAQIGQLNMASPESGVSASATPATPQSRQASPASPAYATGSKRTSQVMLSESNDVTPKRRKMSKAGKTAEDMPTDWCDTDERSAKDLGNATASLPVSNVSSPPAPLIQTSNKPTTNSDEATVSKNSSTAGETTTSGAFIRPPPRVGKLTTIDGSFTNITLNLEQRITSWGRDLDTNTHVYPYSMDTRVPKAALDVIFWRSGIERELEAGADFRKMPDVQALIMTRTSKSIKINGVRLTRSKDDGWLYGSLKQGDIITIFDAPVGFLKFRCEFYIGLSQTPRAPGDVFVVEKEVEKFMLHKSRQSSPLTSGTPSVHASGRRGSGAA